MKKDLTIQQGLNAKHNCEAKILAAIQEFERTTELEVSYVQLKHIQPLGKREQLVMFVKLDVAFP
jgi:hypothetical protein